MRLIFAAESNVWPMLPRGDLPVCPVLAEQSFLWLGEAAWVIVV